MIRTVTASDLAQIADLWNASAGAGEVVYSPVTEASLQDALSPLAESRPGFVSVEDGIIAGFIFGAVKTVFLPGETAENTPGYLTCVFVRKEYRRRGIGTALSGALENAFRALGKRAVRVSDGNPVSLPWIIPGTPGHDHNNAPGVDTACAGYPFLSALGYRDAVHEVALYLNLKDYAPKPEIAEKKKALGAQGIRVGRYDPALRYDYDGMCSRVGSEYWREVLRAEIACHERGEPNRDPRFIPDGRIPAGPRPIMAAVCDSARAIVAQAGPVDLQKSGRGWFTGICTDPLYEGRGIGTVLFNELMGEFIREGAAFSTIFTGEDNHARKIYERTGFRPVRTFAVMKKELP